MSCLHRVNGEIVPCPPTCPTQSNPEVQKGGGMNDVQRASLLAAVVVIAMIVVLVGLVLSRPSDMTECINKGGTYYDNSEGTACTFDGTGL